MLAFALCTDITDKPLGEWVEIFPEGTDVIGRDGRRWKKSNPQMIIDYFIAGKIPLAIDYEHAADLKAPKGELAPAAGWINELELRENGSIWGKVEWTKKAQEMIEGKEYRFLSPAFKHTTKNFDIVKLTGAALTNRPNLELTALNHQEPELDNENLSWSQLSETLGCPVQSPEQVLSALNSQHETQTLELASSVVDKYVADGIFPPAQRKFLEACCNQQGVEEFEKFASSFSNRPFLGHAPKIPKLSTALNSQSALTDAELNACSVVGVSHQDFLNTNRKED